MYQSRQAVPLQTSRNHWRRNEFGVLENRSMHRQTPWEYAQKLLAAARPLRMGGAASARIASAPGFEFPLSAHRAVIQTCFESRS